MNIDEYAIIIRLGGMIDVSRLPGESIVQLLEDLRGANLLSFHVERSSDVLGQHMIKMYMTPHYNFSIKFSDHTLKATQKNTYLIEVPSVQDYPEE